jgi:hypothetical protein
MARSGLWVGLPSVVGIGLLFFLFSLFGLI